MTESMENQTTPVQHNRLNRALAWVGIIAGSLFIVTTVFFSGYVLGKQSGDGGRHGPHPMMLKPFHGPNGGPNGPMGPEERPRSERLTPPAPSAPSRP